MAITEIYRACKYCDQVGEVPMEEASPGDPPNPSMKTCPMCDGELWILEGGIDLSDVTDKFNDIVNKLNDIKQVVDAL